MEHIVQFGVCIDDDRIEKEVVRACVDETKKLVDDTLKPRSYYDNSKIFEMAKEQIKAKVDDEWDDILEKIIDNVSNGILRRKAVKEMERGGIDD